MDELDSGETLGIGHTRWATHGEPNTVNAHPHLDYTGKIAVVHNGIIENYGTLKTWLQNEGAEFVSETDTEVIANLTGYFYAKDNDSEGKKQADGQNKFEWAVQRALQELHGTFGLAIVCSDFPDMLIGAKKGSPLILGVGNNEYILASDAAAIVEHTTQAIYLADNEMVIVGPEIGVASTKAFTAQVAVLTMLAIELGRRRHISSDEAARYIDGLSRIPDKVSRILEQSDRIKKIASANIEKDNWLFLGRGFNYPVALEGALKLKEISYIHAEGLPAAEMKHGPIALIVDDMPAVFVATSGPQYDKIMGNIAEVRARGGKIIAVATEGDENIKQHADHLISIPDAPELLQPMLTVVPLQLLAYHAAVLRGHDVDKPRNLAKSVTVE